MAVDQIDILMVAERRRHDLVGLVLLPVARLLVEQEGHAGFVIEILVEAVGPVMRRLRAETAPDLDDIALGIAFAAQRVKRELAGGLADHDVVATDKLDELVGIDVAVENEDGNARRGRFLDDTGQTGRFLRRNQDRIDFLDDEILDVGDLFFGAVAGIRDDQFDLGMQRRLGPKILVELHAPRLDGGDLREADGVGLVLRHGDRNRKTC